jgi:hypothetical protein
MFMMMYELVGVIAGTKTFTVLRPFDIEREKEERSQPVFSDCLRTYSNLDPRAV